MSRARGLGFLLLLAGCAPAVAPPPAAGGTPEPNVSRGLPPVPQVVNTLAIDVVYPGEGAALGARDSTFIFGNVGRGDARLTINGTEVEVALNGAWLAFLPVPQNGVYQLSAAAVGETATATRSVRLPAPPGPPGPATIDTLEPMAPRVAVAATARSDSTVIGRRALGGDQSWDFFWPNGTRFLVDDAAQGFYRVRLTGETTAWVAQEDIRLLPPEARPPGGFVGPSFGITPREGWVDLRFGMSDRLPFRVVPDEWGLSVEFYGATGRAAFVGYGPQDEFVEQLTWDQPSDEVFRVNLQLTRPLWGYRYRWEGNSLVVEVRRPPTIDPSQPLRGLRLAIDAGHRGSATDIGAIGPTRLTEVEATLLVTRRLAELLRNVGADVLETRPDTSIVPLGDRPVIAQRSDAQLFISVHFNAFPDGVDPFANHGTMSLFYWPHSIEFARHLQREIQGEFQLPDRGIRFQNLAITRSTWMPSVLTETLYMMFPQQEAALRDPQVIDRIAAAHLRAMESFVRERATMSRPRGSP